MVFSLAPPHSPLSVFRFIFIIRVHFMLLHHNHHNWRMSFALVIRYFVFFFRLFFLPFDVPVPSIPHEHNTKAEHNVTWFYIENRATGVSDREKKNKNCYFQVCHLTLSACGHFSGLSLLLLFFILTLIWVGTSVGRTVVMIVIFLFFIFNFARINTNGMGISVLLHLLGNLVKLVFHISTIRQLSETKSDTNVTDYNSKFCTAPGKGGCWYLFLDPVNRHTNLK